MRSKIINIITILLAGLSLQCKAQDLALKTNALYWAATTPNASLEYATDRQWTIELTGAYNPWTFKDDKKMRFWAIQPQAKYWLCEKYEGHFFGVHLHGAQFFGGFRHKRYDGYLAGFGLSYGYDWILSPHWNLEAEIGLGYAHLWFKESERIPCVKDRTPKTKDYIGPTRVSLSFSYIF